MGRVRRGGYILTWWKGDHEPRHVHIRTDKGEKLGRLDLATRHGLEGWTPTKDILRIIDELEREGRL